MRGAWKSLTLTYDYLEFVLKNIESKSIEDLLPFNQDIITKFKSPIYELKNESK